MANNKLKHGLLKDKKTHGYMGGYTRYILKEFVLPFVSIYIIFVFIAMISVIPSGSMLPGIIPGDRIVVTKFDYNYSEYSLPWHPFSFESSLTLGKPNRGDIVVFQKPKDNYTLIKRLIALPNDVIAIKSNKLYINGVESEYKAADLDGFKDALKQAEVKAGIIQMETLDGKEYAIMHNAKSNILNQLPDFEFTVPEDYYFFLGDNRDNSADSRYIGPIHKHYLIGKARFVLFSHDFDHYLFEVWNWPWTLRLGRFFKQLT